MRSGLRLVAGAALVVAAAGCTTSKDVRGYIFDEELASAITPGVDNRQSVQDTLGSPSTTSDFGPQVWYYISRDTKKRGFFAERMTDQKILAIAFNDAGEVVSVKRYGREDARRVPIRPEKTPVRGRTLGFFKQLFANIGRFAPGQQPGGPGRPPGT